MTAPAKRPATYGDLEALPPHVVGEIIFGTLITQPRPNPRHGGATTAISALVTGPFQFGNGGPGGWLFVVEPELHLGPHVVVPELAGWRRDRLPSAAVDKAYIDVAPDWVLETVSPSTEKRDKGAKRTIYATYGVDHLWHLDPRAHSLETFKRADKSWTLGGTFFDSEDVCAPPFDAITFSLGLLWPFDDPTPETST